MLDMNSAPVTVTTTTPLLPTNYTLIASNGTATVTGIPGALTVNGSGIAPSCVSSVSVAGGQLVLTVIRPGATVLMIQWLMLVNIVCRLLRNTATVTVALYAMP